MRTVRLGAVFGALCVLGSCIPVDDDPPVTGSKQIQQLSAQEIVALCDWATDYMGGRASNKEDYDRGEGIYHRCNRDIGTPTEDQDEGEFFISFNYLECPQNRAAEAAAGCTITVSEFAGWLRAAADAPCEPHYVTRGDCTLEWPGVPELP